MNSSKICPKCNGTNIFRHEGISKSTPLNLGISTMIPLKKFEYARITRYICLDCGFSEEWFEGKELDKIKNNAD